MKIPCVRLSGAPWYQCTAQNSAESKGTRAHLFVDHQETLIFDPIGMRFCKSTRGIQPEPEPEVIYLCHVERARTALKPHQEDERVHEAPVFNLPICLIKGQRTYFEPKVNPATNPNMRVEWCIIGKPLAASTIPSTQHPESLEQILMLDGHSRYQVFIFLNIS